MSLPLEMPVDPDRIKYTVPAMRIRQPIGDIYVCAIDFATLKDITHFDVRRVLKEKRDVEAFLGIQRPLNNARVAQLEKYVNFVDATFPTSIIVSIDDHEYADYNEDARLLTLSNCRTNENQPSIAIRNLCRVLDGQHRIAGLNAFQGQRFDLMVALFIGIDISDQAYIFATVNLEQTKVNKSLVYDLFDLAKSRSPFKTSHNVALALDSSEEGPFYQRIRRLGVATQDRMYETISQATFVESLLRYISDDPKLDRDALIRGNRIRKIDSDESRRLCFRNMFIDERDIEIAEIVENYFIAISRIWTAAWNNFGQGNMLNKTNGFRAFMSVFGKVYVHLTIPGHSVSAETFEAFLRKIDLKDEDFTTERYKPGTSGEASLRNDLTRSLFS